MKKNRTPRVVEVQQPPDFATELQSLINRHSKENGSDTPDFILAKYLDSCLAVFNSTLRERETWYGRKLKSEAGPIALAG